MGTSWAAFRQSFQILGSVLRDPRLLRVELAFFCFNVVEFGSWIAILVYAYQRGGVAAAGIIGAAQLVPAAIFAPLASVLGDRYRRERVLAAGYVAQALATGLTGLVLLAHPPLPLATLAAAVAATSMTVTRPVQGALLPDLAKTVGELTAANVVTSWIEGIGLFAGPALAGAMLSMAQPGIVFLILSGLVAVATLLTFRLHVTGQLPSNGESSIGGEFVAGLRVVATGPEPRAVITFLAAHFFLIGAIDILVVGLSFRVLHTGSPGVGFLSAAWGLGSLLAAAVMSALVSRRGQLPSLTAGVTCWGLGLSGVALATGPAVAAGLIGLSGAGRPLLDVAGRTLLQRVVPRHLLARALGLLEGVDMAAEAAGIVLVPVLFAVTSTRTAFIIAGALLPILFVVSWRPLRRSDAFMPVPPGYLSVIRSVPFFSLLPAPVIEYLAASLIPLIDLPPGTRVVTQGEEGDRFYIVAEGEVEVSIGGQAVRTLGKGSFFGEIALLRDVPRTATITALTTLTLFALERDDFLEAVTGHAQSRHAAESVADAYLDAPAEAGTHPVA